MEGLFIPKKFISRYEDKQCLPKDCQRCLFRDEVSNFGTFCNLLEHVNHDPNYSSLYEFDDKEQKHPDCPLKWIKIDD